MAISKQASIWVGAACLAIAICPGCRFEIDMSGAHYTALGNASLEFWCEGVSGKRGPIVEWEDVRLNELGEGGEWNLDFNHLPIESGETMPAKAYASIQLPGRPAVGKVRAKIECQIWRPQRPDGGQLVRWTTTRRDAEVVFEKVQLAAGGALDGRVTLTGSKVRLEGQFHLRLEDSGPLMPAWH